MITVDCAVEAGGWPDQSLCQEMAEQAVTAASNRVPDRVPSDAEVSLLFTNDSRVRSLNAQWRSQDKPTNVLSFATSEGGGPATPVLGDIVLAHETIAREASEQGKTFDDHLTHLIIHGFLHLINFDHIEDGEADEMERLEREICASLGIADPYAEH